MTGTVPRRRRAQRLLLAGCICAAAGLSGSQAVAAERGLELVTPLNSLAQIDAAGAFSTPDGSIIFYSSGDSLAGAIPNGPFPTVDSYASTRGPDGWTTEWVTDAADANPGTVGSRTMFATADGRRQLMVTENAIDAADTFEHSADPYLRISTGGGRELAWLAPGPRAGAANRSVLATNDDLSVFVIQTEVGMVPEDTNNTRDLYLVTRAGATLLASTSVGTSSPASSGYLGDSRMLTADGTKVFFTTTASLDPADVDTLGDLYRRNDDGTVTLFSPDRRTTPLTQRTVESTLFGASPDGDTACFLTRGALVDADASASSMDVYCYTASTDTLTWASDGAVDNGLTGVAISADASTALFASTAKLTPEAAADARSLYARRLDEGRTYYIGPVAAGDTARGMVASTFRGHPGTRGVRISDDGRTVVYATTAGNAALGDVDSAADVYRWTLEGGTQLISAAPGAGASSIGSALSQGDVFTNEAVTGRVTTPDFRTVYFTSQVPHVAGDTDGGYYDVYQWTADGGVQLLSPPGDAPYDAFYLDSAEDGSNVFILTAEPIHPLDANATRDVYVSRVGGGFTVPYVPPACSGDACQGTVSSPPDLPREGSSRYSGRGDHEEAQTPFPTHRLLALTPANRRALARRGRTVLRVRVTAPGRLTVLVTGRIGRKGVRVAVARDGAARAGTLHIPIALSRRARAHLSRTGRLRLRIAVGYSESDSVIRQGVVLRG